MGISGRIAKIFLTAQITPLIALLALLAGTLAVLITPKEEEPQIDVTFANIYIPFPGASTADVERLVSTPAEQVLGEIAGVEHIYSLSKPGMSVLTVQFEVGEPRTEAIVNLYNQVFSHQDWLPPNLGTLPPIVKPMGIDDVPIITLTLWHPQNTTTVYDLQQIAHTIEAELKRVPGTRDVYTVGAVDRVVQVRPDPVRLSGYGLTLNELGRALQAANHAVNDSVVVRDNQTITVQTGQFLRDAGEIAGLIIAVRDTAPVYLRDVADIRYGPDTAEQIVRFGTGPAAADKGISGQGEFPAVTLAVAKKPGENAVVIAKQILNRLDQLRGTHIPDDVQITVTRNYGETARAKARQLIAKLIFATGFVVLLVWMTLGRREAVIVGSAVVITLLATLFASWMWGFTINRVSLFALIFSIGILVDDAIVVVENIHRHRQQGLAPLPEIIPVAVDEVGGPTILATLTVIAALLPMAFVSGLMGPYMSPIPINASMGMFISLAVAFIITPWLALKLIGDHHDTPSSDLSSAWEKLFTRGLTPFLRGRQGRPARWAMFMAVLLLIAVSLALPWSKTVVLKMLPFDNKSEIQVVVDLPEGTTVEQTARVLQELARYIRSVPEVTDYQLYAGTASPINFNGLVRQYYARSEPHMGDIQINLQAKHRRDRQSHQIARELRQPLQEIGRRYQANVKIVEVPPGPPVIAPIVAEIYGLDYDGQRRLALNIAELFSNTPDIVDVDTSVEAAAQRLTIRIDKNKAAMLGIDNAVIVDTLSMALSGADVTFLRQDPVKYPTPIRIELSPGAKADLETWLNLKVRNRQGTLVPITDVVTIETSDRENAVYHKDLLPVTFVTGDLAGELDSPLYGMFDLYGQIKDLSFPDGSTVEQFLTEAPDDPYRYSIKWDGEWQVTFETFRDMGMAYAVGIVLIYLLIVAQFRSYLVPLVIMTPIPLTVIGVLPGHALFDTPFTATSMIGMIALAGIIVRNSILLVDFIQDAVEAGLDLQSAVIKSAAVRAKPILLTALAAMLGALFILDDPIFSGLAVSLICGIFISTLLTLAVIPVLYYAIYQR